MEYANVKTIKEFQKLKGDIEKQLVDFMKNYDQFIKSVAPSHWRTTGTHYHHLRDLKGDLKYFTPVQLKDLEHEMVRDQVLTDEEKDFYNTAKKYNI